jgi:hypothetical protein
MPEVIGAFVQAEGRHKRADPAREARNGWFGSFQAACASKGEILPPLGFGAMLPVACRRCIHLIAELGLTSNQSAASRRDAPDSTAFTTRSRNSKGHGFGIDPPSRIRINAHQIQLAEPVGESRVNPAEIGSRYFFVRLGQVRRLANFTAAIGVNILRVAIIAAAVLGESVTIPRFVGMAAIIVGVYSVTRS